MHGRDDQLSAAWHTPRKRGFNVSRSGVPFSGDATVELGSAVVKRSWVRRETRETRETKDFLDDMAETKGAKQNTGQFAWKRRTSRRMSSSDSRFSRLSSSRPGRCDGVDRRGNCLYQPAWPRCDGGSFSRRV